MPDFPKLDVRTRLQAPAKLSDVQATPETLQADTKRAGSTLPPVNPDGLRLAFARLHAGLGDTSTTPAQNGGARAVLPRLQSDLNRDLFDDSPLMVTGGEALDAHDALMHASAAELNGALASLSDDMLNRYVGGIASAAPFEIDDKSAPPLREFAKRVAKDLTPAVGATLVGRLDDTGKRRLLEGVLQLDGADVQKLRTVLGDEGFALLARGGKPDSIVGGALIAGKVWQDNVTDEFKTRYAAAADGTLPIPARAKETVFLTGPGLFGDELPGYLEPNRRALEQWGVPKDNITKLAYNTADDPSVNADKIYEQVKAQHDAGKHVVVMGHSKFGRDMLEAFHRHPDLQQMVDGAVMMQPAISAPIAKDLALPAFQKILDPVLQIVGGNRAAFNGLAERGEDLPPWPKDVPTMVYSSSTESPAALLHAGSGPYYEHVYNVASDGAVAFQDQAALDGAHLVTLPGLADHAQPGLTFTDACEHFAKQLDAGAPDAVVSGLLQRMRALAPSPAMFDGAVKLWTLAHSTPDSRAHLAQALRDIGPALDRFAVLQNRKTDFPLVNNVAMTQALVSQLFDRVPA